MHYLGLCCIVKDETPFLEEWIAFHTLMGVESFIIYDNASAVPVAETIGRMIEPGYIKLFRIPGKAQQVPCYNHCLNEFGKDFFWLGFIDMDEFALPVSDGDLRVLLSRYEKHAALGLNQMNFGTSGHKTRPEGLQIENYTMAMPEREDMNRHVKLFTRPKRTLGMTNPHIGEFKDGELPVNTSEIPIDGPFSIPPVWDKAQLNHYYYRSTQDYFNKLSRVRGSTGTRHHMPAKLDPPPGTIRDLRAALYAPIVRDLIADAPNGSCAALARAGRQTP